MTKAKEIIEETLKAQEGDVQRAVCALEDGAYLEDAGYTDEDQTEIECAHAELKEMLKNK